MSLRLSEFVVSLLIAYGFASLGEMTVRRRSRGLFEWNQSFLVGASVAATLLFPLTLLVPRHALLMVAGLLLGTAIFRLRDRPHEPVTESVRWAREASVWKDVPSLVVLLLIGILVVQFAIQNLRLSYFWDGYQIWASKALVLYERGGLTKDFLVPGQPTRLTEYPPMVPMYGALVSLARGAFEWNALKPLYLFFYVSLLVSTCQAAGRLMSTRLALATTALLALLPGVSTGMNAAGYADMPQAALVAGALAALLSGTQEGAGFFRCSTAWILAGVLQVKSEGILLLTAACVAIGVMWLSEGLVAFTTRFRKHWRPIVAVALCFLLRHQYLIWVDANDLSFTPIDRASIERAFSQIFEVPRLCVLQMLNTSEWALFWPAFLVSTLVILMVGTRVHRMLVLGTGLAIAAYTSIFYFTNLGVAIHIEQAYNRLLAHVAPAAAIVIVAAYSRIRGSDGPTGPSNSTSVPCDSDN